MAWPQPPQMQIGHLVALGFDHLTKLFRHALIGIAVEQNGAGISDQTIGPAGDDAGPNDTSKRVHPKPAESTRQQQSR